MKKTSFTKLLWTLGFAVLAVVPSISYAGECYTGPVHLADQQAVTKYAVTTRDGPCSEPNTSQRLHTLSAGSTVTVVAKDTHGWHKVKNDQGQVGWIWQSFISEYTTSDRFAGQNIPSQKGYGASDTHAEFAHLFGGNSNTDTSNNNNDTTTNMDTTTTQEPSYNVSSSMQKTLNGLLQKLYNAINGSSSSQQKATLAAIISKLQAIKADKPHLKDVVGYLVHKLEARKASL